MSNIIWNPIRLGTVAAAGVAAISLAGTAMAADGANVFSGKTLPTSWRRAPAAGTTFTVALSQVHAEVPARIDLRGP